MGLDMYLERRKEGETQWEEVQYWRKANAIRGWFSSNLEGFEDNARTGVTHQDLKNLLAACQELLKHKDDSDIEETIQDNSLCPTEGFFFGGTAIDEWFWSEIETTSEMLSGLNLEDETYEYSYMEWY